MIFDLDPIYLVVGCVLGIVLIAGLILIFRKRKSSVPQPLSPWDANPLVEKITEKFPTIKFTSLHAAGKGEAGAVAGAGAGAGLQGNLAQTPLHDLLQYLSLGNKTGILEIVSGRRTGRLILKEGKVCKNIYRGKEGMDAIYMMLDLSEGDFEFFEQEPQELSPQAEMEVVDIIMLWMDRKQKKK